MKKILIIHNSYKNLGGEDIAVRNEISFLKEHFEVDTLLFSNSKFLSTQNLIAFFSTSNRSSNKILFEKIQDFKPDFAYVHNSWFNASLGIFKVLERNNVDILLKLHNFRYFCTRSIFSSDHFGEGKVCQACGSKKEDQGYFNKYYEESRLKSMLVAIYGKRYFKLIKNFKMKVLVLTNFHKNFLNKLSIESDKVAVFPNYIEFEGKTRNNNKKNHIVYAGRISEEKGVKELIQSFLKANNPRNVELDIIGIGPQLSYLKKEYTHPLINFMGGIQNEEVLEIISTALAVVTATKMFEGQPTLLCEASTLSIPSIFPNSGGISEFFPQDYPLSFEQFNYEDLTNKIEFILETENSKDIGKENMLFLDNYLNSSKLIDIFSRILL